MNIKSILNILKEFRYFKKIIKRFSDSLLPGQYKLYPSIRAMALNKSEVLECADKYFDIRIRPSKITKLAEKINKTSYYSNKTNSNLEKYAAIYSANNSDAIREIKLFSFERNEILTICTSRDTHDKQLNEYNALNNYFGMPKVTDCPTYDNSYIISMISLLPRKEEHCALDCIARCTVEYHKEHPEEKTTTTAEEIISNSKILPLPQELIEKINSEATKLNIPLCLQHGDLSRSNLLYGTCDGKTDFWWIDWEHSAERIFFYDYFFYILNTALYYSDETALKAYLSSEYDSTLTRFFADFGMKFDPSLRKDYFLIFALDFLRERVCDNNNSSALEMYRKFILNNIFDKE